MSMMLAPPSSSITIDIASVGTGFVAPDHDEAWFIITCIAKSDKPVGEAPRRSVTSFPADSGCDADVNVTDFAISTSCEYVRFERLTEPPEPSAEEVPIPWLLWEAASPNVVWIQSLIVATTILET